MRNATKLKPNLNNLKLFSNSEQIGSHDHHHE